MNALIWFLFGIGLISAYCLGFVVAMDKAKGVLVPYLESLAISLRSKMTDDEIIELFKKHDETYFTKK